MPAKQRTTGPGPRSETHGRFGKRRTFTASPAFNTVDADLGYVQRGPTGLPSDKAQEVREKLLNGEVKDTDLAEIRGYYVISAEQNPLKYDVIDMAASRGLQPIFGPNLKPPIFVQNEDDEGTADVDESLEETITESEVVSHTYGSMGRSRGENRKFTSETSSHPRNRRPTLVEGEGLSKSLVGRRTLADGEPN